VIFVILLIVDICWWFESIRTIEAEVD